MGRRLCVNDNNHPNNIYIDAIKPDGDKCRVCGGDLKTRDDDQDESAINKRHNIYYDTTEGTLASAYYFRDLAGKGTSMKVHHPGWRPQRSGRDGRTGLETGLRETVLLAVKRSPVEASPLSFFSTGMSGHELPLEGNSII